MGAPYSMPEAVAYTMNGGFAYVYTSSEIHELAFRAGYEVALLEQSPFPHAVLIPIAKGV